MFQTSFFIAIIIPLRYMKNYKILSNKLASNLLPYISKIFFVIGGLVNLQSVKMKELVVQLNLESDE